MFYVNDIRGLKFTGPLEELENWGKVSRKQNIPPQEKESGFSTFLNGNNAHAVAEYQKYVTGNNMVEPLVHAHQIMSSPVLTILLDTPLTDAWLLLQKESVKQLIVITDQRKVLGMLSDRDILKRINVIDNTVQTTQDLSVSDVVNQEIISTHSISDIRRIAKVLAQFHIDALPVVENEILLGIVTRGDILRGFAANPKLNLYA
jgi:acetoin utilization protein AcuB